jgi:exosortase
VQQQRLSIVALFTGIYGLMGLVWGREWLQRSFFPFVLLLFCLPVGSLAESVTFPLRMLVTKISVAISHHALGVDVIQSGSQIFDPHQKFGYDVATACSGIRSLISLLALTTIYGFVVFRATWKRLLMVAVAVPLAVLGNVVRITGVIIAAEAFGQDVGTKVHDGAGFVTFAVAIVCVMLLSHWMKEDGK